MTVATIGRPPVDPMIRFMEHVYPVTEIGCWLWDGALRADGYGRFYVENSSNKRAHKWLYEQTRGPVPEGMVLDHVCRVRSCVKPDHLRVVTIAENVQCGDAGLHKKQKTHCPHGHAYKGENLAWVLRRYKGRESRARICRTCYPGKGEQ